MNRIARRHDGFTLIELMVCVAIFALIAVSVQQIFNSVMSVWMKGDARLEMYQNGRNYLERLGVYMRSTVRPDLWDHNHDGTINASDTGVNGIRFIGVNHASQAASSATITSATQGVGRGYSTSDAISFMSAAYSSHYDNSDMIALAFSCVNSDDWCYSWGKNYAYLQEEKLGYTCSVSANEWTDGSNSFTGSSIKISPTASYMRPSAGASVASSPEVSPRLSDLQLEYFGKNVPVATALSGAVVWDSAMQYGRLPTLVRIIVTCDTTSKAVPNPIYFGTYVNITPIAGIEPGTGYY